MIHPIEGNLIVQGSRFAIVVSRFNDFICDRLQSGAIGALLQHGALEKDITVVKVPGAFEIPLACQMLAQKGKYDAIIALGCVIQGGTAHFEFVSGELSKGLAKVMMEHNVPVAFGVLTTNNLEQAIERAGSKMGNKGVEAALAAIEMVNVLRKVTSE